MEEMMAKGVKYRRVYDDPSSGDGMRILVDRVWPRGVREEEAELRDPARREAVDWLRESAGKRPMTLLTAARDLEHSQASVLAHWLNEWARSRG